MGYTISWEQLPFSDFTYISVMKLVRQIVKCKYKITDWGFVLSQSDNDSICIERYPSQMTFCKTNNLPYTKECIKALILMVEFGAAHRLRHDSNDMTIFLIALEEVHAIHPLVSYDEQKNYFIRLSNM